MGLKERINEETQFYTYGDNFFDNDSQRYLLTVVDYSKEYPKPWMMTFICLDSDRGNRVSAPFYVGDAHKISHREMSAIIKSMYIDLKYLEED